jgi:hypothetical protein
MDKKMKKALLFGGAIAAVGAICYYFFRKPSINKELLAKLVATFTIEEDEGILRAKTVKALLHTSIQLCFDEYRELIIQFRADRRAKFDNKEEYMSIIEKYTEKTAEMFSKNLDAVLNHFNISKSTFDESLEAAAIEGEQDVILLFFQWPEILALNLKKQTEISVEEVKKLYKIKIEYMSQTLYDMQNWAQYVTQPAALELGLKIRSFDVVFNKLGIEEEEMAIVVKGLDNNQSEDFVNLVNEYNKEEKQFRHTLQIFTTHATQRHQMQMEADNEQEQM